MNPIQNLHTHTTFCDGVATVEQMIESAIAKNFKSIGFSGHSFTTYSPQYTMSIESTNEYKNEVKRLKEKYKDQIEILVGFEAEYLEQFVPYYKELLDALLALGYKQADVKKVIANVSTSITIEEQIKEALKLLLK